MVKADLSTGYRNEVLRLTPYLSSNILVTFLDGKIRRI